ncbi:MAG: hypothetical protein KKA31_02315 [Candidatus Margulisbacteria bacterium]|nr:hypothetical protein [Candidatus Margulisiibacteriota bacterium]
MTASFVTFGPMRERVYKWRPALTQKIYQAQRILQWRGPESIRPKDVSIKIEIESHRLGCRIETGSPKVQEELSDLFDLQFDIGFDRFGISFATLGVFLPPGFNFIWRTTDQLKRVSAPIDRFGLSRVNVRRIFSRPRLKGISLIPGESDLAKQARETALALRNFFEDLDYYEGASAPLQTRIKLVEERRINLGQLGEQLRVDYFTTPFGLVLDGQPLLIPRDREALMPWFNIGMIDFEQ